MAPTRPYTIIFSTTTVDGRIASSTGYSMLSCPYDLARLRLLRGYVDAVMVGANTVRIDNPGLVRRLKPRTRRYYRVIVDGRLSLRPSYRVFTDGKARTILVTSASAPRDRLEEFRRAGVDILLVHPHGGGYLDLREALEKLYTEYGVESILVEGGGRLSYTLLRSRLVDELRLTVTPSVFGAGVSIVEDPEGVGFRDKSQMPRLKLVCHELCPCGNCVHIAYRVLDAHCCPTRASIPVCLSEELRRLSVEGEG